MTIYSSGASIGSWSSNQVLTGGIQISKENMDKMLEQEYFRKELEYQNAQQAERMDALKSLFPRGHDPIDNLDIMVDIARGDQLNPMYEQVLREFDEAKLAMSRAANRLAGAVKLSDSDEVEARSKSKNLYVNGALGSPRAGQMTYSNGQAYVYNGNNWSGISSSGVGGSATYGNSAQAAAQASATANLQAQLSQIQATMAANSATASAQSGASSASSAVNGGHTIPVTPTSRFQKFCDSIRGATKTE